MKEFKYVPKEKFDEYFDINILPQCKNWVLISATRLSIEYPNWYKAMRVHKYYKWLDELAKKKGLITTSSFKYYTINKEQFTKYFFAKTKGKITKDTPINYTLIMKLWLWNWYHNFFQLEFYNNLEDFCIQNNLIYFNANNIKHPFRSYEKWYDFFYSNIRPLLKYNLMLSLWEIKELGFYNWYLSWKKFNYINTLEKFCNENKLKYKKTKREKTYSKYSNLKQFNDFFNLEIKPILWSSALTIDFIKKNNFLWWYRALSRYWYAKSLQDYCFRNNIKYEKYWLIINTEEDVFNYYKENIQPFLMPYQRITYQFCNENRLVVWYRKCIWFYWTLENFHKKNNILFTKKWDVFKSKEYHLKYYFDNILPVLWDCKLTYAFCQKNKFIPWYRAIKKFKLYKSFDHFLKEVSKSNIKLS